MQNSIALEQKHIRDLNNRDKNNNDTLDGFYRQAMTIISSHLNEFYNQYATDTGLTLNEVSSSASHWDLNQFHDAISVLLTNVTPDNDLSKRLQVEYVRAQLDKRNAMAAMIGAGMDVATFKAQNFGNKELSAQYSDEYNYRAKGGAVTVPKDIRNNDEFNQNMWTYSDVAKTRAQETLDRGLKKGVTRSEMNQLTKTLSTNDNRVNNNISSAANNVLSRIQLSFRIQAIDNTNAGKKSAYKDNDTDNSYLKWLTERDDKVCDECEPMDGEVYPAENAPVPQDDTHYNCRCSTVECDEDGNLSEVHP